MDVAVAARYGDPARSSKLQAKYDEGASDRVNARRTSRNREVMTLGDVWKRFQAAPVTSDQRGTVRSDLLEGDMAVVLRIA